MDEAHFSERVVRRIVYHMLRGLQIRMYDLVTLALPSEHQARACKDRVKVVMGGCRKIVYSQLTEVPNPEDYIQFIYDRLNDMFLPPKRDSKFWNDLTSLLKFSGLSIDQVVFFTNQVEDDLKQRFSPLLTQFMSLYAAAEHSLDEADATAKAERNAE